MARTEIKPEFISMAADNSFAAQTSSSRLCMHSSHFAAHLALLTPDEKILKTGVEYELGKTINDIRVDEDSIVKAVVTRYPNMGFEPPVHSVFTEFFQDNQLFIDVIDVPGHKTSHNFFGYRLTKTDEFNTLSYNTEIPKGAILAKTDSYGRDGAYNYGLNANVVYMSHPSVSDDGFVVSESFTKRAQSLSVLKRAINITKNTIPVNLNGDPDIFKFLPNIGEMVRPDGLLCALRERNDWFSVSDLSTDSLNEVDVTFDRLVYVNPGSIVTDITVERGNYGKNEFTPLMTEQLDRYAEAQVNYYQQIITQFEKIEKEKKSLYGSMDNVRMTPRLHQLLDRAYVMVQMAQPNNKNKMCYRKLLVDQYRIVVTTVSVITPKLGHKLSDIHASKGVICAILPDEMMPVDKNGNRADVISDSAPTISRMNLGRSYESYLGAFSRDNRQNLSNLLQSQFGPDFYKTMPSTGLDIARKYLRDIYSFINSEMVAFIDSLNDEEMQELVREVHQDGLFLYYPPDNERNVVDVISDIENSPYKPLNDKVTYVDNLGRTVQTVSDVQIGVLYFMMIDKIGNSMSAVSSAKVNNFGFPVKGGSNLDKFRYPHSLTPNKFIDETGGRILTSFMGPEAIADMMDLALNPNSHKAVIRSALESDKAFSMYTIDRNTIPYGQTKSLQILRHIFRAGGMNFVYEPPEL